MSKKSFKAWLKGTTSILSSSLLGDQCFDITGHESPSQHLTFVSPDGKVFNMGRNNVPDLLCEYITIQSQFRWPIKFGQGGFNPEYLIRNPVEYAFLEVLLRMTPDGQQLFQSVPADLKAEVDRDFELCLSMIAFVAGGSIIRSVAADVSTKGVVAVREAMELIDQTLPVFDDGVAGQRLPPLRGEGFFERQWNRFVDLGFVATLPSTATH